MKESVLQSRYAQSLYSLAQEENMVEEVRADILLIKEICSNNSEFKLLLKNPVVKPGIKKRIINSVFGDTCQVLTSKFLEFIVKKRRDIYLLGICESFLEIYNKEHNIKVASLVVSQKISPQIERKIKDILSYEFESQIELKTNVDKEILGGFSLYTDSKLYDASFRKKLSDLKKDLLTN